MLLERKEIIVVIVHKDSTAAEVLYSYIHALVMANLKKGTNTIHSESQSWMDKHYEGFIEKVYPYIFSNIKICRLQSHVPIVWFIFPL